MIHLVQRRAAQSRALYLLPMPAESLKTLSVHHVQKQFLPASPRSDSKVCVRHL